MKFLTVVTDYLIFNAQNVSCCFSAAYAQARKTTHMHLRPDLTKRLLSPHNGIYITFSLEKPGGYNNTSLFSMPYHIRKI